MDLVPAMGGLKFGEKGLNYKPYETPGMSRVNTELPQSNPLFQAPQVQATGDNL